MSDYEPVKKALASGADPSMLCATCPWDRNCVTPPAMTSQDIEEQMRIAEEQDRQPAEGAPSGRGRVPVATLIAVAVYAGKDTALQACPVLALRLRSSDGRKAAEAVKGLMQAWED